MPILRPIIQSIVAPAVFFLLSAFVGLSALFFAPHEHNPLADGVQAETSRAGLQLPVEWSEGSPKRGRIMGLTARNNFLFAGGPGMGVYFRADEKPWRPFNEGLGRDLDATALSSNAHGFFAGTSSGRLYLREPAKWKLVADAGRGGGIEWITGFDACVVFCAGGRVLIWKPGSGEPTVLRAERDGAYLRKASFIELGNESFAVLAWLRKPGAALVEILKTKEMPPIRPGEDAGIFPPVRAIHESTGAYLGAKALLPADMMGFPIHDLSFRIVRERDIVEILLSVENIGVAAVAIRRGEITGTRIFKDGLPIEPVSRLTSYGDALFAGTQTGGVYRLREDGNRFEPSNAGLMFLPP